MQIERREQQLRVLAGGTTMPPTVNSLARGFSMGISAFICGDSDDDGNSDGDDDDEDPDRLPGMPRLNRSINHRQPDHQHHDWAGPSVSFASSQKVPAPAQDGKPGPARSGSSMKRSESTARGVVGINRLRSLMGGVSGGTQTRMAAAAAAFNQVCACTHALHTDVCGVCVCVGVWVCGCVRACVRACMPLLTPGIVQIITRAALFHLHQPSRPAGCQK